MNMDEDGMMFLGGGCTVHGDEFMRDCTMCGGEFCAKCNPRATLCPDCAEEAGEEADDDAALPKEEGDEEVDALLAEAETLPPEVLDEGDKEESDRF